MFIISFKYNRLLCIYWRSDLTEFCIDWDQTGSESGWIYIDEYQSSKLHRYYAENAKQHYDMERDKESIAENIDDNNNYFATIIRTWIKCVDSNLILQNYRDTDLCKYNYKYKREETEHFAIQKAYSYDSTTTK
jgi:hypothetical protein